MQHIAHSARLLPGGIVYVSTRQQGNRSAEQNPMRVTMSRRCAGLLQSNKPTTALVAAVACDAAQRFAALGPVSAKFRRP